MDHSAFSNCQNERVELLLVVGSVVGFVVGSVVS